MRAKTQADLDAARAEIPWVDDHDLRDLEKRSRVGAALLGLFTWGGGRVYDGDLVRGIGAIVAMVGWFALGAAVPGAVITAGYWLGGVAGAAWSVKGARARNRYCAIRNELLLTQRAVPLMLPPAAVRIPAPATGPHAALIDRLRKLASLRASGVLDESAHQSRKIDVLGEAASALAPAELEDLMFALLPLRDEGVLLAEDFDLMKQLGSDR